MGASRSAGSHSALGPTVAGLALVALSLTLYGRSLGYEFLNWDDSAYVLHNPWIREATWDNFIALLGNPVL